LWVQTHSGQKGSDHSNLQNNNKDGSTLPYLLSANLQVPSPPYSHTHTIDVQSSLCKRRSAFSLDCQTLKFKQGRTNCLKPMCQDYTQTGIAHTPHESQAPMQTRHSSEKGYTGKALAHIIYESSSCWGFCCANPILQTEKVRPLRDQLLKALKVKPRSI
jgi:hypothetical protein